MTQLRTADVPSKTVERLILYRRLLARLAGEGYLFVHSHEIAEQVGNSAAQVRRDLMSIGYTGNPARGYAVKQLLNRMGERFDQKVDRKAAMVGIGKLGRAILAYLAMRQAKPRIVAAFDTDPAKAQGEFAGCPCYPLEKIPEVVAREGITLGILTVPAEAAQSAADLLLMSGVRGLLNFAPVPLKTPAWAVVEHVDIATKMEKLAFIC